ncbi:type VI secretion lipoprotein TssJ [Collimonas humicola]|uniref:type VI secretion lipoprotein TssJ n=1 Tax=Collimonas humicola TaxID=2825886 RepID=UPI001B8D2E73|nr:type VI secretion lipoprotein TssJ [Collimonas humicola]
MTHFKKLSFSFILLSVTGCSMVSHLQTAFTPKIDITLIGSRDLNLIRGHARPVHVCLYLTAEPAWNPDFRMGRENCATHETDKLIIASEHRVVSPDQIQRLSMEAPKDKASWVVVDADFANRASNYKPARVPIENKWWSSASTVTATINLNGSTVAYSSESAQPAQEGKF